MFVIYCIAHISCLRFDLRFIALKSGCNDKLRRGQETHGIQGFQNHNLERIGQNDDCVGAQLFDNPQASAS